MTADFRTYLSAQIVAEQNTVSYRNVSRALKVHVDAAKCMLYEYHEDQNKRKPGSVHATYILAGTKKRKEPVETNGKSNGVRHDEDEPPPSSPPPFTSSMLEPSQQDSDVGQEERHSVPVKTVTLAREEELDETREQYETITSIHIYSLSANRVSDLVSLTDIGRNLYADTFTKEDPLIYNKIYGVIQNPEVRRRKGRGPVLPDGPLPKFIPSKTDAKPANKLFTTGASKASNTIPSLKKEDSSRPSSRDSTSTKDSKLPNLKRDASDLFKAFAKGKKPAPKEVEQDEDTPIPDADEEGESEDDALFLDTNTRVSGSKKRGSDAKKEREDKAAKLRKMMDSDDEKEAALPNVEDAAETKEAPPAAKTGKHGEDDDAVAWSDSDSERQREKAVGADQSAQKDGDQIEARPKRRRGKRKVMKKRTMKDEDGYLVTKEEAAWESFSEDEPEQVQQKPKVNASGSGTKSSQGSSQGQPKPAKANTGAKRGGNIMSFFGKK